MKFLFFFIVLFVITVAVLPASSSSSSFLTAAAAAAPPLSKLPKKFLGRWHGYPEYTPVGPRVYSNGGYTFDIHSTSPDGTSWLMENAFTKNTSVITLSYQQFWVDLPQPGVGSNTYCGILENFETIYNNHVGAIRAEMKMMEDSTENFLHWQLNYSFGALDWTLTYNETDDTLLSLVQLPNNVAVHLRVTLQRVSDVAPVSEEHSSEIVKQHVLKNKNQSPLPPPCNLTNIPSSSAQSSSSSTKNKQQGGEKGLRPRVCPVTGLSSDTPGVHNPHRVKHHENHENHHHQHRRRRAHPKTGIIENPRYKNCVWLNNYTDFKVYWNWNIESKTVDVLVSSAVPADKFAKVEDAYIAIGWNINWPYMYGLEGVIGYFSTNTSSSSSSSSVQMMMNTKNNNNNNNNVGGCIIPIYSNQPVGTPVPNPKQILDRTELFTTNSGTVLNMAFTRPWATGHYDLQKFAPGPSARGYNDLAFAIGKAGSSCDSFDFGYHGGLRGVHGFSFAKPEEVFAENMYC